MPNKLGKRFHPEIPTLYTKDFYKKHAEFHNLTYQESKEEVLRVLDSFVEILGSGKQLRFMGRFSLLYKRYKGRKSHVLSNFRKDLDKEISLMSYPHWMVNFYPSQDLKNRLNKLG